MGARAPDVMLHFKNALVQHPRGRGPIFFSLRLSEAVRCSPVWTGGASERIF